MKIEIEIKEVPEKTLYMTQHFGDGTLGKTKFNASHVLPSMSLLLEVKGKRYLVESKQLIEKTLKAIEELKK